MSLRACTLIIILPPSNFLQLQRALALGPVADRVLDELSQLNLAVGDQSDQPEVLSHVVADGDAVETRIGLDQRIARLSLLQDADHLQRLQRIRFERLLGPVEVRLEPAPAAGAR